MEIQESFRKRDFTILTLFPELLQPICVHLINFTTWQQFMMFYFPLYFISSPQLLDLILTNMGHRKCFYWEYCFSAWAIWIESTHPTQSCKEQNLSSEEFRKVSFLNSCCYCSGNILKQCLYAFRKGFSVNIVFIQKIQCIVSGEMILAYFLEFQKIEI